MRGKSVSSRGVLPESREPRAAVGTPAAGLKQLLAEVRPHVVHAGAVGDYVALQLSAGLAEAARAFSFRRAGGAGRGSE